jgi:hypothetical protein
MNKDDDELFAKLANHHYSKDGIILFLFRGKNKKLDKKFLKKQAYEQLGMVGLFYTETFALNGYDDLYICYLSTPRITQSNDPLLYGRVFELIQELVDLHKTDSSHIRIKKFLAEVEHYKSLHRLEGKKLVQIKDSFHKVMVKNVNMNKLRFKEKYAVIGEPVYRTSKLVVH